MFDVCTPRTNLSKNSINNYHNNNNMYICPTNNNNITYDIYISRVRIKLSFVCIFYDFVCLSQRYIIYHARLQFVFYRLWTVFHTLGFFFLNMKTGFYEKNKKRNVILEICRIYSFRRLNYPYTSASLRAAAVAVPHTMAIYEVGRKVRGKPFSNKQPSAPQRILCKLTAKTDPLPTHVYYYYYYIFFRFYFYTNPLRHG